MAKKWVEVREKQCKVHFQTIEIPDFETAEFKVNEGTIIMSKEYSKPLLKWWESGDDRTVVEMQLLIKTEPDFQIMSVLR